MTHTLLRPHWRPSHLPDPIGFDVWIGKDGARGWVKILNPDASHCKRVWEVAPHAKLCLRLHSLSEEKNEMLADPVRTGEKHAVAWHAFLNREGLLSAAQQGRIVCEGINEPDVGNPAACMAVSAYEVARIRMSARLGLGGSCCVLQLSTGWPANRGGDSPPDWSPFDAVREALLAHGGYLGVHEYWDRRGPATEDWTWNPGRITQQPSSWDEIPVLVTECGFDSGVRDTPEKYKGWREFMSPEVYTEQLATYDSLMRAHPKARVRVQAAFIFTHDYDHPWESFDTRPILDWLCAYAEQVRQSSPPVEEPPVAENPQAEENWQKALGFVLRWEGGFSNHPADRGGATNRGITLATYNRWRRLLGLPPGGVEELMALSVEEAAQIYRELYWIPSGAHALPWPDCLVVFDTAVLFGVETCRWYVERARGDGYCVLGLRMLSHVAQVTENPDQVVFWAGWRNRVLELRRILRDALGMR